MTVSRLLPAIYVVLLAAGPVLAADLKPRAEATFALHVLPVLKTKCFPVPR